MADTKNKGLVDYLMADPTLTSAQKIDVIIRLAGDGLIDGKRAAEVLFGQEPKSGTNVVSANVIKCGCKPTSLNLGC